MSRAAPALSCIAAALVALAPAHAQAQDGRENTRVNVRERSRPEYDPYGLRFGGFRLDASLGLSAESTDNLRAAEEGQAPVIDDVIYRVAPDVRLSSTWSRHALSVAAGGASATHQDTTSEDYDTYYIGANGRFEIGSRTQITADARLAHQVEPRSEADGTALGDPIEYEEQRVSIGVAHAFNRVRLSGRFAMREQDFDESVYQAREFSEDSFTGRVEYAISPRLAIVGQLVEDTRDYDNQPALSSNGETYTAGLGVTISNLLRGEVTAGQFSRDYDSGEVVDGTAIDANVEWYVTGITTLSGFASRNVEESGVGTNSSYVAERYGVRVDHELLRNLILSAAYSLGNRDYTDPAVDREDDTTDMLVEAEYLLNRRVSLRARAMHEKNDSEGANRYRDFEETRFLLGATLRL